MFLTADTVNDMYEVYLTLPQQERTAVAGEADDNLLGVFLDGEPVTAQDFRYEVAMIIIRDGFDNRV